MGSGAAAGASTLDFLRNSQQVSPHSPSCFLSVCVCALVCHIYIYTYTGFEIVCCVILFQFQALRAVVQANPQILQVPPAPPLHKKEKKKKIYFPSFLLRVCFNSLFVAAYASRAWETKSQPSEVNSRASG